MGGLLGEVDGDERVAGVERRPAQLFQRSCLELEVAELAGQLERRLVVVVRVVVPAEVAARLTAPQVSGDLLGDVAAAPSRLDGPVEQAFGVGVGEGQVGGVGGLQPGVRGAARVACRGELLGRGLGPAGEQARRTAVPADPDRLGNGLVGDEAHDVVGEAEVLALRREQPGPYRPVGPGGALLHVEPTEGGHVVEGEAGAEQRALGQQVRDGVARRGRCGRRRRPAASAAPWAGRRVPATPRVGAAPR